MRLALGLAPYCCVIAGSPAFAQAQPAADATTTAESQPSTVTNSAADQPVQTEAVASTSDNGSHSSSTDILSKNVITVLLDGRIAVANGERSFVHRGLGKTQFQGTSSGKYNVYAVPQEADLIWTPRFTDSLSASVSAACRLVPTNRIRPFEDATR